MVYITSRGTRCRAQPSSFSTVEVRPFACPPICVLKAARSLSGKTKLPETWSCHGVRSHGTASSNSGEKQTFRMTSWQTVRMKSHRNASCSNSAIEHDLLKMTRYLLDTNIASFIIKGNSPAVDRRLAKVAREELAGSGTTKFTSRALAR